MTREEAKSCIGTIELLQRLAYNIHGVMDVIDADNCKKIIKTLEKEPKTGHWKAFIHSAYHGTDEDGEPIWREVTVYHCNQCNRRTVIKEKYCPNCGAKMEGEE